MTESELTELFRKLGAANPEQWARSQLREGIPQLARYLFLRQAWRLIVSEGDATWIDKSIDQAATHPGTAYSGVGCALHSLRARGASDEEIVDLVRGMQAQLLASFCYLLEDPGDVEAEVSSIAWTLAQVNEEGDVVEGIHGLHESVLETDPTGREMRPRLTPSQPPGMP